MLSALAWIVFTLRKWWWMGPASLSGDNHSALTVAQIEADATYDEFPVWCNIEEKPADWQTYLTLRTTAVLRLSSPLHSTSAPNPGSGNWQPL